MYASARLHEESRVPGDIRFGCKRTKGARDERPFLIKDSKLEGVDVGFGRNSIWNGLRGLRGKRERQGVDKELSFRPKPPVAACHCMAGNLIFLIIER
jgi:hypothetical protein